MRRGVRACLRPRAGRWRGVRSAAERRRRTRFWLARRSRVRLDRPSPPTEHSGQAGRVRYGPEGSRGWRTTCCSPESPRRQSRSPTPAPPRDGGGAGSCAGVASGEQGVRSGERRRPIALRARHPPRRLTGLARLSTGVSRYGGAAPGSGSCAPGRRSGRERKRFRPRAEAPAPTHRSTPPHGALRATNQGRRGAPSDRSRFAPRS